ncbi:DUF1292 domain-containing protein [Cohnella candidum]|uniref:DUF1292 domain-containing protein n=1 Tax=Cohnella candidum TaxID=2674991 RepID=UPI001F1570D3|nr:DUF1292 domain-containing protein [Cohnella candidum]
MTQEGNGRTAPPSLKQAFGNFVELEGGGGGAEAYRILAELDVGGRRYAVLQSESMRKEGEIEVFRVVSDGEGNPVLETVEDDEEWELAAEAYDDLQFGSDERP